MDVRSLLIATCLLLSLSATSRAVEDQPFVTSAARATAIQIALAEVGTQRARDKDVADFAKNWLADSQQLKEGLERSAQAAGAELSAGAEVDPDGVTEIFVPVADADFDLRWIRHAAVEIDRLLVQFRKASQADGEARLKSFAEQSLPILERDLAAANALQARLAAPTP